MNDEELIARYRAGDTLRAIAEAAGWGLQRVAARIAKLRETHSLPYRKQPLSESHPRRKLAAARKELVTKLHEAGVPNKEIAAKVGVDEQYVYQMIWRESPKNYDAELARLNAELATMET